MEGIIVDVETGEEQRVPLSPEETALAEADRAAETVKQARLARLRAAVAVARPGPAIIAKLKDGTPLSAGQIESSVRWLLLRELVEEVDP